MARKKRSDSSSLSGIGFQLPDDGLWIYEELTDDICRKVLCQNGETYTDEEIKLTRELLEEWADVFAEALIREIDKPP